MVLHSKDEPPKHLAVKASGVCVQEGWRAVENRNSTLKEKKKDYTQNLTYSESQYRGSNLKISESDILADLGKPPGVTEVN